MAGGVQSAPERGQRARVPGGGGRLPVPQQGSPGDPEVRSQLLDLVHPGQLLGRAVGGYGGFAHVQEPGDVDLTLLLVAHQTQQVLGEYAAVIGDRFQHD